MYYFISLPLLTLGDKYHHLQFTDEESEVERGRATCPGSHSWCEISQSGSWIYTSNHNTIYHPWWQLVCTIKICLVFILGSWEIMSKSLDFPEWWEYLCHSRWAPWIIPVLMLTRWLRVGAGQTTRPAIWLEGWGFEPGVSQIYQPPGKETEQETEFYVADDPLHHMFIRKGQ